MAACQHHYQHPGYDAAVYRKSAVPHGNDLLRVREIFVELEKHEIKPCADDSHRDEPDEHIVEIILFYAETGGNVRAVEYAEQKTKGDENAIKIYIPAENGNI